jgi:hypothetical protein
MIKPIAELLIRNDVVLVLNLSLKKCILDEQPDLSLRCAQDLKQSSQEEVFTNHG